MRVFKASFSIHIVFLVSELLRKYDPKEVAGLPTNCIKSLMNNGECDWEIQNLVSCNFDRDDCEVSLPCKDLVNKLVAKSADIICETVLINVIHF